MSGTAEPSVRCNSVTTTSGCRLPMSSTASAACPASPTTANSSPVANSTRSAWRKIRWLAISTMRYARRVCAAGGAVAGDSTRVMWQPSRCAPLFASQLRCVTLTENQGATLRIDPECTRHTPAPVWRGEREEKCERLRASASREVHADQFRERTALEFLHDPCLVNLDGARTDAELRGNVAVLVAGSDERENLALALRQALEALVGGRARRGRHASLAIDAQRFAQHVQQHGVIDRLFEEIEGAVLERGARGGDIAMSGEHDDRHLNAALAQHRLQLESGHPGHAQIRQHAAGPLRPVGLDEGFGVGKWLRAHPFERQQQAERVAYPRIVIDQKDGVVLVHVLTHRHKLACGFVCLASRMTKRAPPKRLASLHRSPPCWRRKARLKERPRPIPLLLLVTKGSNKRSMTFAEIPGPESSTAINTSAPRTSAASSMRRARDPLAGSASNASRQFVSRLWTTISSCVRSTMTLGMPARLRSSNSTALRRMRSRNASATRAHTLSASVGSRRAPSPR